MGTTYSPNIVTDGLSYCFDAADENSVPLTATASGTHYTNDLTGNDDATSTNAQLLTPNSSGYVHTPNGNKPNVMYFTSDVMDPGAITATDPADAGSMYQSIDFWYFYGDAKASCCDTIFGRYHFRVFQIGNTLYFMHGVVVDETGVYQHPTVGVSVNTWYHVVATRQDVGGTNKFRMYLNNSKVIDSAYNPTANLWNYTGQSWGMSGVGHSHVYMSMARIYNKSLSEEEIEQNFEAHRGRFGI